MTAATPAGRAEGTSRTKTVCCAAAGTAGLLGSLACGASMALAAAGVGASAAVTGMAGMNGRAATARGLEGVLLRTAAFALRRPAAAGAVLAGAVLYGGMYGQSSPAVMYASIATGYATWT